MLRCYVERYPSEVERSMRESARATKKQHFPETGWSEEELVALYKQSLDLILHPEVFLDLASVFGIPGMASNRPAPLTGASSSVYLCIAGRGADVLLNLKPEANPAKPAHPRPTASLCEVER